MGPDSYLNLVRRARAAVGVPVIASLNGSSRAGWTDFARLIEQAGASALELTMYHVPTDLLESGQMIEARYSEIVEVVCGTVAPPVAVKLTPYVQSKMIQLAIPEYTSPTQWRYLFWALDYGGQRGVSITITRIRE